MRLLILSASALAALTALSVAHASGEKFFDPESIKGESSFVFPDSKETCIVPTNLLKFLNIEEKAATKKQKELCEVDFNSDPKIAICPKTFSTNPATEVYEVPKGMTKEEFEKTECRKPRGNRRGDKIAKFKQSITCGHASAGIGYFELSQVLGGAGNVPPAVVRTMRADRHRKLVAQLMAFPTSAFGDKSSENDMKGSFWGKFQRAHGSPGSHPELFTDGKHEFIYGSLSSNPKGEELYREMYGRRRGYEDGLRAFMEDTQVPTLQTAGNLGTKISRKFTQASVQQIQLLKDLSDTIVMDTIMNQQDRFGNVSYQWYYLWMENTPTGVQFMRDRMKSEGGKPEVPQATAMAAKGAVKIKVLVLKDNDCGVTKDNKFRDRPKGPVLPTLRHISPDTYQRLLYLATRVDEPAVKAYFRDQLLIPTGYLNESGGVLSNIKKAAATLKQLCVDKKLSLDLSLETFMYDYAVNKPYRAAPGCALDMAWVKDAAPSVNNPAPREDEEDLPPPPAIEANPEHSTIEANPEHSTEPTLAEPEFTGIPQSND